MSIKEVKDGIILQILVKPNQPKFKVELDDGEVVVYATQEPEKGKVNKEIIKEFTKLLGVQVELASGFTSKQKHLLVKGIQKQQLEDVLLKVT